MSDVSSVRCRDFLGCLSRFFVPFLRVKCVAVRVVRRNVFVLVIPSALAVREYRRLAYAMLLSAFV